MSPSCSRERTRRSALAPRTPPAGRARCRAAEIDEGRSEPSVEWRRDYSLMLGPRAAARRGRAARSPTAPTLSAHQVDALSGTLIALTAELRAARQRKRQRPARRRPEETCPSRARSRSRATSCRDEEPLDWDAERGGRGGGRRATPRPEDPGAARRFWFEHATGAGKTVAALGFVEASRTGGILILTHRRNLVDQFLGELRRPRLQEPHLARRCWTATASRRRRPGHGRDLPVVRAQRGQGLRRLHDRHLRRGPHGARREDERLDPRSGSGPVFIGMTATGALIARHVTDLFPTQTSRFDLAQAARRGVIAPLRCVRIPPGVGVRSIANVPLRRGEVDQDFDQEELAALLDQTPFNLAVADLYKTRFKDVPGVVYSAGVKHAHNVAEAFQAAGHQGQGRLGRDAQARAGPHPRRLRARRDRRARERAAARRGLELAARHGLHAPRADGLEAHLPAARRPRDAPPPGQGGRHRRRLRPPGHDERRPGRDAALAARPRRLPRRRDRRRPGAPRPRPPAARRAPRGAGHRGPGAARAGVRARAVADRRRAPELGRAARLGGARGRARGVEQLAPREGDAALRPDRRAAPPLPDHLPAAQPQHAAAPARARRDRRPARRRGVRRRGRDRRRLVARRAPRGREGAASGARRAAGSAAATRPQRWLWRLAEYSREVHEEYAVQRWPETKRLLGLLVNSSGAAHARNARRLVQAARKQDRRLSAALLAAALAHTPEAEEVLRRRAHADGAQAVSALARELLRNFPKGKRRRGGRRRKKKGAGEAEGTTDVSVTQNEALDSDDESGGERDEAPKPRRKRCTPPTPGRRPRPTATARQPTTTESKTPTRMPTPDPTRIRHRRARRRLASAAGGPRRRRGATSPAVVSTSERARVVDAVGRRPRRRSSAPADPAVRPATATPRGHARGGAPSHSSSGASEASPDTDSRVASTPARRSDVADSASSAGNSRVVTFSPIPSTAQPSCGRALDQDPGDLAAARPDVVRPLDRARRPATASAHAPRPPRAAAARRELAQHHRHQRRAARGGAVHARPWRPRPAVCSSAVTSVPCGAPASGELASRARSSSPSSAVVHPRARRSSRPQPHLVVRLQRRASPAASPRLTASASVR